jgi:hypothetical protein
MADEVPASQRNPFPEGDPDRRAIWEMLVARDIDAFVAADWGAVAGDFVGAEFQGIDARRAPNPDHWRLAFPTLAAYRDAWLAQARDFGATEFAGDARAAIFEATVLRDIEIAGDRAVARKKFDGALARADGGSDRLLWQTLYFCRREAGRWKISGFVGYLPNPMGG